MKNGAGFQRSSLLESFFEMRHVIIIFYIGGYPKGFGEGIIYQAGKTLKL